MSWTIDRTHSRVGFGVRHMMVATVRGEFEDFDADIVLDEQEPSRSSALITIKTASVNTRDENRDNHLRSQDFFDAEHSPEITFASKRIEKKGNDYRIVGDLTIRGVTKEVELEAEFSGPVKDPWGNTKAALSAEGKINRKDFGLNWNAALEAGGMLVSDTVKLSIDLELAKEA